MTGILFTDRLTTGIALEGKTKDNTKKDRKQEKKVHGMIGGNPSNSRYLASSS